MTKREQYEKRIREEGLTQDVLEDLLADIGRANEQPSIAGDEVRLFDDTDLDIDIDAEGLNIGHEVVEYDRCGGWETRFETTWIYWDDLVKNFLREE